MGLTPSQKSILGTFINGRNATDDFIQFANNHGGAIFGWIDANGNLQGSLLQGVLTAPGGADTNIQFNNGGVFAGDANLVWDTVNKTLNANSAVAGTSVLLNNPTAATLSTSQSSSALKFQSNFWNGASTPNGFTIQSVAANGLNIGATLKFSYFGGGQTNGYLFDQSVTIGTLNVGSIQQSSNVFVGQVLPLASASNAAGGKTTYTGTFGGIAPPQSGMTTTIAGFVNGGNNGTFVVFSCNSTTLVVWNSGGVSESAAATATTSTLPYTGGQALSILTPGSGSLSFQGTSYAVAAQISTGTSGIGLVLGLQGDPKDVTFLAPYSNADKSHGVHLGAIYDGVGLNAGVLQWGQDISANHLMNLLMPDGLTAVVGSGNGFTAGTSTGTIKLAASNGDGTTANSLVITGAAGGVFNCGVTAKTLTVNTATPTGAAGTISFGTTTGTTATTGASGAPPAQVLGYLQIDIAGTKCKIPYYNN
jgi:hypothetical protein